MTIKIDQEGLSEGSPGRSRTDGLATGARVTLTNTEPGTATRFNLPWAPPGDTTALSSLVATEDPNVWTFDPTPDIYGSYLIELIVDEGLVTETRTSRILAVRTPRHRLVIPALNERGDSRATLQNQTDSDNNAIDYIDASLNAVPQAAWWRALHELFMVVDLAVTMSADQMPIGPEDAGKFVTVGTQGDFVLVAPEELSGGGGTTLPNGTYDGQPLLWVTELGWVPSAVVALETIVSRAGSSDVFIHGLDANGYNASTLAVGGNALLYSYNNVQISIWGQNGSVYSLEPGVVVDDPEGGSPVRLDAHVFTCSPDGGGANVTNLRMGTTGPGGAEPAIGFLGAPKVGRQTITGVTTQDQVDSLVAAFVALGLVTDGR